MTYEIISSLSLLAVWVVIIKQQQNQRQIMATQKDLADSLTALTTQVAKIGDETAKLIRKIADLETALNNVDNVSPEVQTAFDALKAQVQVVDDAVPDAPAT